MSTILSNVDWEGLTLAESEGAAKMLDSVANSALAYDESLCAQIHAETDLEKKIALVNEGMENIDIPIRFSYDASLVSYGNEPRCVFYYDLDKSLYYQNESDIEKVLKGMSPHVRDGSYLGFADEFNNLWSYILDGKGGLINGHPYIRWKGDYEPKKENEQK